MIELENQASVPEDAVSSEQLIEPTSNNSDTGGPRVEPLTGSVSAGTTETSAATLNIHDVKQSEIHRKVVGLTRAVARKEKKLNLFIKKTNKIVEDKLLEREAAVLDISRKEEARYQLLVDSTSVQEKFEQEIDQSYEDQSQLKATRLFCKEKIKNNLPSWIASLDVVIAEVRNRGHSNKLRWRSKAIKYLNNSLQQVEEDPWGFDFYVKIKKIIFEINLFTANTLLDLLLGLREEYIKSRTDEGSNLGQLSNLLRNSNEKIKNDIVPLKKDHWSSELKNDKARTQEAIETNAALTAAGIPRYVSNKTDKDLNFTHNKALQKAGPEEKMRNLKKIQVEKSVVHAPGVHPDQDLALQSMRKAAVSGDFKLAMALFKEFFENYQLKQLHIRPQTAERASSATIASELKDVRPTVAWTATAGGSRRSQQADGSIDPNTTAGKTSKDIKDNSNSAAITTVAKTISRAQSPSKRNHSPSAAVKSKLEEKLDKAAKQAAELEVTILKKEAEFMEKKNKKKKVDEQPISKFSIPITLDIMKILMQSFKNAKELEFNNAIKVIELMDFYNINPDCHLYNIYMSACERESRWRRCVAIYNDMRKIHHVIPNEITFEILINCCRNSIEEPAVIFETLRLAGFESEMCYRAALCNAANRVSKQVLLEKMHELSEEKVMWQSEFGNKDTYQDYVPKTFKYVNSPSDYISKDDETDSAATLSTYSFPSILNSEKDLNTRSRDDLMMKKTRSQLLKESFNNSKAPKDPNEIIRKMDHGNKKSVWSKVTDNTRATLPAISPSKLALPGYPVVDFEVKIARMLPKEFEDHVMTRSLNNETYSTIFAHSKTVKKQLKNSIDLEKSKKNLKSASSSQQMHAHGDGSWISDGAVDPKSHIDEEDAFGLHLPDGLVIGSSNVKKGEDESKGDNSDDVSLTGSEPDYKGENSYDDDLSFYSNSTESSYKLLEPTKLYRAKKEMLKKIKKSNLYRNLASSPMQKPIQKVKRADPNAL